MHIRPRTIQHKAVARLTAVLAVTLLAAALAACTNQAPVPEAEQSAGTNVEADAQQWAVDYAECMRGHGIDMEDPDPEGGVIASGPMDESPARQEATTACIEELGPSPVGGGSGSAGSTGSSGGATGEELREELLDLAACLREQGFDVEDPAPGSGLGMPEGITEEALEACDLGSTSGEPAQ
jgi:hypothetical protein